MELRRNEERREFRKRGTASKEAKVAQAKVAFRVADPSPSARDSLTLRMVGGKSRRYQSEDTTDERETERGKDWKNGDVERKKREVRTVTS